MSKAEIFDQVPTPVTNLPAHGAFIVDGQIVHYSNPVTLDEFSDYGVRSFYVAVDWHDSKDQFTGRSLSFGVGTVVDLLVPASPDADIDLEWALMDGASISATYRESYL